MKNNRKLLLGTLAGLTFLATQPLAQDFAKSMQEMGETAVKGYTQPFVEGIGVGMNSQWSYTAKTMSFLSLPVGFNAYFGYPVVMVSKDMKSFDFKGELPVEPLLSQLGIKPDDLTTLAELGGKDYDLTKPLTVDAKGVPTIYGNSKAKKVSTSDALGDLGLLVEDYNELVEKFNDSLDNNGIAESTVARMKKVDMPDSITLPFRGLNTPIAPTLPPVGVTMSLSKIPVLDNITLGVRWMPEIENSKLGSVGMLGFMGKYEFTHLIPVINKLPLIHLAAYYAQTTFDLTVKNVSSLSSFNQVAMFQASADASFLVGLGVYGGIGWERSSLDIKVEELKITDEISLPGFKTTIDGSNNLRTQVGARFSFAVFDIYADANFGSTTVYNAGIALGLNGL